MSLSKTKLFLAMGLTMAMTLTLTGTASALDGARLWKPYQGEQFGGGRRSGDGIYGSVEGIYWKITRPSSTWVGYTNPDGTGGSRLAFNGNDAFYQVNSMNMNAADSSFNLGTRIEFGNRKGHHGWLISGYGLPAQTTTFSQQDASMVINDPENISTNAFFAAEAGWCQVLRGLNDAGMQNWVLYDFELPSGLFRPLDGIPHVGIPNAGYLWGWFPRDWNDPWSQGQLAPIPINFARATVSANTGISSVELMYTYRPHPFKWGEMELLGGARYWEMDDEMNFLGQGYDQTIYFTNTDTTVTPVEDGATNSDESGPLTVLATTAINGRVINRIGGPQFGIKVDRRNKRWTFGAEFRFMAGINSQSQTVNGTLGSNGIDPSLIYDHPIKQIQQSAMKPYMPIGLIRNTKSFYHHENKTYFSPGVELRLNAKWQWTDAVGVNFGFNTMFVDNVARGANVIDYSIQQDGSLFGIRGGQNESIIVFGLNFGLTARR